MKNFKRAQNQEQIAKATGIEMKTILKGMEESSSEFKWKFEEPRRERKGANGSKRRQNSPEMDNGRRKDLKKRRTEIRVLKAKDKLGAKDSPIYKNQIWLKHNRFVRWKANDVQ